MIINNKIISIVNNYTYYGKSMKASMVSTAKNIDGLKKKVIS